MVAAVYCTCSPVILTDAFLLWSPWFVVAVEEPPAVLLELPLELLLEPDELDEPDVGLLELLELLEPLDEPLEPPEELPPEEAGVVQFGGVPVCPLGQVPAVNVMVALDVAGLVNVPAASALAPLSVTEVLPL